LLRRVQGLGFRVEGLNLIGVWGILGVWGLRSIIQGLGARAWDLGLRT